jgi:hypothetical protein
VCSSCVRNGQCFDTARIRSIAICELSIDCSGKYAKQLISAVAVDGVASSNLAHQVESHCLKCSVSRLVPIRIVEGLEVIHIDETHAVAMPVAEDPGLKE